ncbi:isoprenylcysteine carboxylmethyltransferase family protein [Candidatus Bathyarchaeota archaeon]|nr:isoprenylcysteine carboxylmethyltransferase family protein [Candidatus Bathyarchaeota archaeon]
MGEEHPGTDTILVVLCVIYLAVFVADSIFLHLTTFLGNSVAWQLRFVTGCALVGIGFWLTWASHRLVFDEAREEPELRVEGVYSMVRHPMYLGILLLYLGLFAFSLSLALLAMWLGVFAVFNRFAAYEEEDLVRVFGERYSEYMRGVPRWLPRKFAT